MVDSSSPFPLLPDPCNDRQVASCSKPVHKEVLDNVIWGSDDKPDWKIVRDLLAKEGWISKPQMVKLLRQSINVFKSEPNMVQIEEPVCVVGDLHGQYYDLLNMLTKAGDPGSNLNYLFLGDYVDRGIMGIECMVLLLSIKINYPKTVQILRGNHESRNMTEAFTFKEEVQEAYDEDVYELFMELFDTLPVACLVAKKYLAMHGGISPDLKKLEQIQEFNRFEEVPLDGIFCDLVWSDPMDDEEATTGTFTENNERECSNYFGKKPVKKLLKRNKLISIFRGHQVQVDGFKMHRWGSEESFPYVITIFSAPNYCGSYNNKAAVLILNKGSLQLKQYTETEAPYRLPDGLDLFKWSFPFLAEKISSMLYQILKQCTNDIGEKGVDPQEQLKKLAGQADDEKSKKMKRMLQIKAKVATVGRMSQMMSNLRENQEVLLQIKNMSPDGKIPRGLLLEKKPTVQFAQKQFGLAKKMDAAFEKRPKKK